MNTALSQELTWRGFAGQTTFSDPSDLDKKKLTFYWGVDPSSDSMTIGNLATALMVRHFIEHGYKAVLLVGGATGIIGDPDGKSKERKLLSEEDLARNKANIINQYKTIFAGQDFEIVDNHDWFKNINYIEFLRDVGKHVPLRQMINREFVSARLGEGGSGISYAEFSYSLIQGYDFLHLYRTKGVTLQVCGSDQWGNSIAGVELVRRLENAEAYIWATPLVVNKQTGVKFGKTEQGAVWLDAAKTSPYDFYQFWLNVDDESAQDFLKIYTLLSKEDIEKILSEFNQNPGQRKAQKILSYEVTRIVHGEDEAKSQERIAQVLFGGGDNLKLGQEEFKKLEKELPKVHVAILDSQEALVDVLVETCLASSKTEARRFLQSGAIYIDNEKISEGFDYSKLKGSSIIRRGKNNCAVLSVG
jgi:tyrosyl-tRNA synthetase